MDRSKRPVSSGLESKAVDKALNLSAAQFFMTSLSPPTMASTILAQALITIPGSHNPAKLGVSAAVSVLSSSLSSACRISTPRVPFCPLVAAPARRRSFAVRAAEEDVGGVSDEESGSEVVAVEKKPPRTPRVKLGDVMGLLNKRAVEAALIARPTPDIRPGDVVLIRMKIPQNKTRLARYKGIVISRQNAGIHTTIRIRRIIAGIGVEITFPLYSPNLKELTVIDHKKVRRAKLYYLKHKLPKFSTFK